MQMIDVHIPTAYGRELILGRYTQSEAELERLRIVLPPQLPPKITAAQAAIATRV